MSWPQKDKKKLRTTVKLYKQRPQAVTCNKKTMKNNLKIDSCQVFCFISYFIYQRL